eukprot:11043899-Alexandrium_andersonii.AAC.1
MASVRRADLARRHGQCGASRFRRPFRGGCSAEVTCTRSMAVPPGCHAPVVHGGKGRGWNSSAHR